MFGDPTSQLLAVVVLPIAIALICIVFLPQRADAPAASSCERFGVCSIADAFDAESSALWENQILVLQRIKARASFQELLELWERYVHSYPELYEEISLWKWLGYLERCRLIESNGGGVQLTAYGCGFLRYLAGNVRAEAHRAQRQ
jgi:hypothetical protein